MSRRHCSSRASRSAIELKAVASAPTSSFAARRHAHVQIAGGDILGRVGELFERTGDPPAHEQADEKRQHRGDHGRR